MEIRQVNSLKKLLLYSAEDARIILIKLADRLHNMRTLFSVPDVKQLRIARETLEVYIPIANLFGIRLIKDELENLCFQYLFKNKYESLKKLIDDKISYFAPTTDKTIKRVKRLLKEKKIDFKDVSVHYKNLYSIFKKLEAQRKEIPDLEDLITILIIVNDVPKCYLSMGYIHEIFKPKPSKIKDYISVPKTNGYQSLHTTVFGIEGYETIFHIQTELMFLESKYGFAAQYFMHNENIKTEFDKKSFQSYWTKKIQLFKKDIKHNVDIFSSLKSDVFQDRIFTFTPKGNIIDLPLDATPIDFAYAIHTELGHSSHSVLINNMPSSLSTTLKTGDTVKIITDTNRNFPKREWLSFVKTQLARTKIKDKLRKETKENKEKIGREFFEHELSKTSKTFYQVFNNKNIRFLLNEFSYKTIGDLLSAVGEGILDPKTILDKLYLEQHHSYEEIIGSSLKSDSVGRYQVLIKVTGKDRVGFLRSLLTPMSALNINIFKTVASANLGSNVVTIKFNIMIRDLNELSRLYEELKSVEGVDTIERIFPKRIPIFASILASVFIIWSFFAYLFHISFQYSHKFTFVFWLNSLFGIFAVFASVYYARLFIRNYIEQIENKKFSWAITPALSLFGSFLMGIDMFYYKVPYFLSFIYVSLVFIFSYLGVFFLMGKELWQRKH